eukprot:4878-Heterococcus_DN1.PRE.3
MAAVVVAVCHVAVVAAYAQLPGKLTSRTVKSCTWESTIVIVSKQFRVVQAAVPLAVVLAVLLALAVLETSTKPLTRASNYK